MKKKDMHIVVVGGGIAGLAATIVAAKSGCNVTLLEAAPSIGGLLRSMSLPCGEMVDYGTHILSTTGNPEIDATLMEILPESDITTLPGLIAGQFQYGKLQDRKMWMDIVRPDARDIDIEASLEHAIKSDTHKHPPEDCAMWVRNRMGAEVLSQVYAPVLQKLQHTEASNLHPDVLRLFGLQRICAYTPEETRNRKENPDFDAILGYHDCLENARPLHVFYPRSGVGAWTQALAKRASTLGATIQTGIKINRIEYANNQVHTISLLDGTRIACDAVAWTAPASMLLRVTDHAITGAPPSMLSSVIVHFVFDQPLQAQSQYISVFDPDLKAFRITLYQNLRPISNNGFACTVEYLCLPENAEAIDYSLAHDELIAMGLIAADAKIIDQTRLEHKGGFPILTSAFIEKMADDARTVEAAFKNVFLGGKARGQDFFMVDVLSDIHNRLPIFLSKNWDLK